MSLQTNLALSITALQRTNILVDRLVAQSGSPLITQNLQYLITQGANKDG